MKPPLTSTQVRAEDTRFTAYIFRSVTAVVIAHRLTTIREMDTVIVLEKGAIVESGSSIS